MDTDGPLATIRPLTKGKWEVFTLASKQEESRHRSGTQGDNIMSWGGGQGVRGFFRFFMEGLNMNSTRCSG